MSSDDYQVQNIYRYSRKSYKKNKSGHRDNTQEDMGVDMSPRSDAPFGANDAPGCSFENDPEIEINNILNKKCPVIQLAQQQLQRLLDETDRLTCNNTRCCRSTYEFLCMCKELLSQSKCRCILIVLIASAFFMGLMIGAASCGTYLGRFNSPILDCIDIYFIPEVYGKLEDTYYSIV